MKVTKIQEALKGYMISSSISIRIHLEETL